MWSAFRLVLIFKTKTRWFITKKGTSWWRSPWSSINRVILFANNIDGFAIDRFQLLYVHLANKVLRIIYSRSIWAKVLLTSLIFPRLIKNSLTAYFTVEKPKKQQCTYMYFQSGMKQSSVKLTLKISGC